MSTRKEQIEKFRRIKRKPGGCLEASRSEFLAYAFIRGRPYRQVEREIRPSTEKPGPSIYGIAAAINTYFPAVRPVPVPVGAPEDEPGPRKYPWPDVDYDNLRAQLRDWLLTGDPDFSRWAAENAARKAERRRLKEEHASQFTPERIEELRNRNKKGQ